MELFTANVSNKTHLYDCCTFIRKTRPTRERWWTERAPVLKTTSILAELEMNKKVPIVTSVLPVCCVHSTEAAWPPIVLHYYQSKWGGRSYWCFFAKVASITLKNIRVEDLSIKQSSLFTIPRWCSVLQWQVWYIVWHLGTFLVPITNNTKRNVLFCDYTDVLEGTFWELSTCTIQYYFMLIYTTLKFKYKKSYQGMVHNASELIGSER